MKGFPVPVVQKKIMKEGSSGKGAGIQMQSVSPFPGQPGDLHTVIKYTVAVVVYTIQHPDIIMAQYVLNYPVKIVFQNLFSSLFYPGSDACSELL